MTAKDAPNFSLLESYKRRRMAIASMPEIPPSPPPPQFSNLTQAEFEEDRAHRVGYLQGRVVKAYVNAQGNPADGRWGALSSILSLSCTAGRDGRWVGLQLDPPPEDEEDEVLDQLGVVLAKTEEEWAAWEARYERRWNLRRKVEEWNRGVAVELPESPSPTSPVGERPRRRSRLNVVTAKADEQEVEVVEEVAHKRRSRSSVVAARADKQQAEAEFVEEIAPVIPVPPSTPTPKAKPRVARMSTGGKSPKKLTPKPQVEAVASTSKKPTPKPQVVVVAADPLKNSAPFGFGVVKRATTNVKGKEKDEGRRRAKEAEEIKKKQERLDWEKERERKQREARDKEREAEKARQEQEKVSQQRRQEDEAENRRMHIQDVSEMSFIPPSFPSSAIVHSTPRPFGLRSNSQETRSRSAHAHGKDKVIEVPPPVAEESSYSLGISMVSSANLPSQILVPPPTTTTKKKRSRAESPSPTPSPVIRKERPEKKARNDDVPAAPSIEVIEDSVQEIDDISFIPPSFPPGGIITSTPKPPSKSNLPELDQAKSNLKPRETTPPPKAATRPFLLPPTPKNKPLETSSSLPAITSQASPPPSSPTNRILQSNKRPASPTTPSTGNPLKKARTLPAASSFHTPPASPTRGSSARARHTPSSWLRSPEAKRNGDPTAEEVIVARTTMLNVRHILADQQAASAAAGLPLPQAAATGKLPVTPQRKPNGALPTLTDLLASSSRTRKGKGSASAKKLKKTLIVRTPSGERVDLMEMSTPKRNGKPKGEKTQANGSQAAEPKTNGEGGRPSQDKESQVDESVRDHAEPSTMGTGVENYQQLKAAANASMDVFLNDSNPLQTDSHVDDVLPASQPAKDASPPAEPTDPYSDAYHFTEDIVVPTGSKLRTFPGAGGSYPFANGTSSQDPYADNPYDDPYSSAGEHVGISPTKSLSSLAGSDSDSDPPDDSDDDGLGTTRALQRGKAGGQGFGATVLSPNFVFDPRAASTQVPPGLTFGVGMGGPSSLFSAATAGSESGSALAVKASSITEDPSKDPSPQYVLPEAPQPLPSSSSPVRAEQGSSPVRAPPSSNPLFTFSSQAFGDNLAKHVDMVGRLLDKDVDFSGWLKDPEEVDGPLRGVEESP